ncbi:hypothetical protein N8T08_005186 [Aspergillus melleus]|uniref:Uncharacterized protein n=1 Tax=Aspergillus melleus TaxID=138277 RepID=A0ACC3BFK3_9EURO|nr:hypothetical protein N8T08_005186 [Aspergillus melleus]
MATLFHPRRPPGRRIPWVWPLLGLLFTLYLIFGRSDSSSSANNSSSARPDHAPHNATAPCPSIPGMEDILVILKTGVTEARDKVPTHLQTTLRCVPNSVIFSDYAEEIDGVPVHDVLRNIPDPVKWMNSEFNVYQRVRQAGRAALTRADLNEDVNTVFGKPNNPGWKLDKWKFLPMIDEALRHPKKAKWYVFMEADTYFVWSNLVAWLAQLDHRRPYYLGNQMQILDVLFAHGGSGIVLSRPAMERAAETRRRDVARWDSITRENWAGDCVLGQLLAESGVGLLWSWPALQIGPPSELDYFSPDYYKTPWCYAPVTFHHLTLPDVDRLWHLDREWFAGGKDLLLYRDVFLQVVRPQLTGVRYDWDNRVAPQNSISSRSRSTVECRRKCLSDPDCVQYSQQADTCWVSATAKLGSAATGISSGWIPERIDALVQDMGSCPQALWVV